MFRLMSRFCLLLALVVVPAWGFDKAIVEETLLGQEGIAGLKRHEITIDGHRIFYLDNERTTAGRTVMFIHGFGDSSLSWTYFARIFRDGDYRIIIPDLLGFGRSDRPLDADYGYAAQSRRLFALLQSQKIGSVHLVGNSMGGGIAAEMALQQPVMVASLTLMDAAGVHYRVTDLDQELMKGNNFLVPKRAEDFERLLDFVTVQRPAMPRPVLEYLADRAVRDSALHERIFHDALLRDIDFLIMDLDGIKAPTLIAWGEKDRVLSPDNAKVFKKYIPDSRIVYFPNAGHVPMIEIPEESALATRNFIEGLPQKR